MAENEVKRTFEMQVADRLSGLTEALPKDLIQPRYVTEVMSVILGNTDLQKCNQASLLEGICKGAMLGLSFAQKECYLIPYGNAAQFQTDYKGEVKFTKKYASEPIQNIYSELIRKGDTFKRWSDNEGQHFLFEQNGIGGEIEGVFAVCQYVNGNIQIEVMSLEEINTVRNVYSKASQSKAWKSSFGEMAKKVCLRRLCKHIDKDFENVQMMKVWDEAGDMDFSPSNSRDIDPSKVDNPFAPKEDVIISSAEEIVDE